MKIEFEGKKYNVVLTGVKTFRGRDGIGLNGTIVIDGEKVAEVLDSGNGGCLDIDALAPFGLETDKGKEVFRANRMKIGMLEDYVKTLPEKTFPKELGGGKYKADIDDFVNDLFAEVENAKFFKKMEKDMLTKILIGKKSNSTSYASCNFKRPLKDIPQEQLQKMVDEIKTKHVKAGEEILNTNLTGIKL